jgi:hypothetical protein
MTTKQNCDEWIDYAYKNWLEDWIRKIPDNSYLRESAKNMVDRMKRASLSGRTEEAWNLLERLKRLSDTFYGVGNDQDLNYQNERAEIYMECALVAYEMGDLQEALNLFRVSTDCFYKSDLHKAVSYWFFGCVQWQLPAHSEAAVVSWERSIKIIQEASSDANKEVKCQEVSLSMRDAINDATRNGFPPPPPSVAPVVKAKSASSYLSHAHLKFLPYYGSIPAGNPVAMDNHPDMVGVDALEIEGCSYKVFGVRNEREVRLNPSLQYLLAKVSGHSMNVAQPVNIENGDYVLLKSIQQAKNNEIVAAVVIRRGESDATLKRYHLENGKAVLKSESDKMSKIEITMLEGDYIQGVVVAILKPDA